MKKIILIFVLMMIFSVGFYCQTSIEELQAVIDANGGGWTAKLTPYSNLTPEEMKGLLGYNDNYGAILPPELPPLPPPPPGSLPSYFDWRNKEGNNYITEIKNQDPWDPYNRHCGSCYAFATVGVLESKLMIDLNKPNSNIDLAEQMLVGVCDSCPFAGDCNGGSTYNASNFLEVCGVAEEWCDPYQEIADGCARACQDWTSHRHFLSSYGLISKNINSIKSALMNYGPLVAGMNVTSDFFYYGGGVYFSVKCCKYSSCSDCNGVSAPNVCLAYSKCDDGGVGITCVGLHAITIIGWQDDNYNSKYGGGYFICKNSWGDEGWGENGFFKIAYSQMNNCVNFGMDAIAYTGSSTSQNLYSVEGQIKGYYGVNCCNTATIKAFNQNGVKVQETTANRKPNSSSFYRFLLPNGIYTLTASDPPPGYSFSLNSLSVNLDGADQTNKDFVVIGNYNIAGTITYNSQPLSQVSLKITGTMLPSNGITITTDGNGDYKLPYLGPGNYKLTPSLTGYTFNPSSASITITNGNVTQNFVANLNEYVVSGKVTSCNYPYPDVEIRVKNTNGIIIKTTYTDSNGNYSVNLTNGTYTMQPYKGVLIMFSPSSRTVTVNGSNVTGQDFSKVTICRICSSAYFDSIKSCNLSDLNCSLSATQSFGACLTAETNNPNSLLYGQILLVVTSSRSQGQPQTEMKEFYVPEEGDYFVNVINGDGESKDTKVSSARMELSSFGEIFSPSDFNKNVSILSKPIHLTAGEYVLETTIKSQPGSFLTVIVATFDMASLEELP